MFSSNASSASGGANYIEDVFSTYLYTGTGSVNTITNGIDLAGEGGMVWSKGRSTARSNVLVDTVRGGDSAMYSNTTDAAFSWTGIGYSAYTFGSTGYTNAGSPVDSENTYTFASWTFRKQPKFFDVVTYTGDNTARTIAHSLGSVPGCIIIKPTATAAQNNWIVYHRSLGNTSCAFLNLTDAAATGVGSYWNSTTPTSTDFSLGTANATNQAGITYVAYIFAHDAGGFGLTGTDNVITCGSFTTDSSGNATVTLGYEPQWVLTKTSTVGAQWVINDNMRGMPAEQTSRVLYPSATSAESSSIYYTTQPTATGFITQNYSGQPSNTVIYIAIRRGPMKVPTDGTSVYSSALFTGTGTDGRDVTSSINAPDFFMLWDRANSYGLFTQWFAKLAGSKHMISNSTAAEVQGNAAQGIITQTGIQYASSGADTNSNVSGGNYDNFAFKRAPSFFDVVCNTGTGTYPSISHNLQATPELVIQKTRNTSTAYTHWWAWCPNTSIGWGIIDGSGAFNTDAPAATSSTFNLLSDTSGNTYVNYLFATCPGVSKVGSYTGTGTTKQIECGFTAGARFIMIKRTDSTGDWYVYDSARGIVAGNDPYLLLNSTAAEVTSTDYVDTYAGGFELSSTAPAALNASGGTFIFLAIA